MPLGISAGIGAAGSILGGLFGGGPQKTTINSTTNTNQQQKQSGSSNQTTTPTFSSATGAAQLNQALNKAGMNQLTSALPDLNGIQSLMLQNTNQGYGTAQKALQQTLAARGLQYSPLAGASTAAMDTSRIGAGINVMNQMPLLREQLLQQRLQNALGIFKSNPYSVSQTGNFNAQGTTTGTSNTQGTQITNQPGGMLGGMFTGLGYAAPMLGGLFGGFGGGLGSQNFNLGTSSPGLDPGILAGVL